MGCLGWFGVAWGGLGLLEVAWVFLRDFSGLEWFGLVWGGVGGFGLALGWLWAGFGLA